MEEATGAREQFEIADGEGVRFLGAPFKSGRTALLGNGRRVLVSAPGGCIATVPIVAMPRLRVRITRPSRVFSAATAG